MLSIDISRYTKFTQSNSKTVVNDIIDAFDKYTTEIVIKNGGYIHKTVGDSHIISFGAMDDDSVDDIPQALLSQNEEEEFYINRFKYRMKKNN